MSSAAAALVLTVAHLVLAGSLWEEPAAVEADRAAAEIVKRWANEVAELAPAAQPQRARDAAIAAALANALIDQRVFRWGSFFGALEEILPADVRLESIQPVATLEGVRVSLTAASVSGDSLLGFLARLEGRPEFVAVYPGRQLVGPDGDLRLTVEALIDGAEAIR